MRIKWSPAASTRRECSGIIMEPADLEPCSPCNPCDPWHRRPGIRAQLLRTFCIIKDMKKVILLFLGVMIVCPGCARRRAENEAARPVQPDPAAADRIIREIQKDRADTEEWLRSSPHSYLAAVNRIDFGDKPYLTVGRAGDNDVRLDAADIEAHHLKISLDGDRFRVEAVGGKAAFQLGDASAREATVEPSFIQVGRFHLRLSHQRFPAIVVFDPLSPRFKEYKGLTYFPIDLSYRYELPLERDPKSESIVLLSTRGNRRQAVRAGWLNFFVGDEVCRLEVTRLLEPGSGEDDLSVYFRDATSGRESYPLGRYVDLKKLDDKKYLLDFNLAYNPACAFSEYYSCPIPPKSNTLKAAIRAGERDPHYH